MRGYYSQRHRAPARIVFRTYMGRDPTYIYVYAYSDATIRIGGPGYMPIQLEEGDEIEFEDETGIPELIVDRGEVEVLAA